MRTSRPFFEISRAHPDRSWFTLKKENEELACIVVCIPAFASFSGGYDEDIALALALYARGGYACHRFRGQSRGKHRSHAGRCLADLCARQVTVGRSAS